MGKALSGDLRSRVPKACRHGRRRRSVAWEVPATGWNTRARTELRVSKVIVVPSASSA